MSVILKYVHEDFHCTVALVFVICCLLAIGYRTVFLASLALAIATSIQDRWFHNRAGV
jgi:hypothetical protein